MASRFKLKDSFEVQSKHSAFYTGNQIAWTEDGSHLLCQDGASVHMLELESGKVSHTFNCSAATADLEDIKEDPVTAIAVSEDEFGSYLFTSYRSGLIVKWSREEKKILKSWKSIHKGPVARLAIDEDSLWLATGGSDSRVRLWELATYNCIQSLKGCQGVISVLKFRPGTNEVFASGDDCTIRSWDTKNGNEKLVLESHYSQVTGLVFYEKELISCGRDSVICLWDLDQGSRLKTIPVYESLEGMVLVPKDCTLPGNYKVASHTGPHVAVAGEKGVVRVWQVEKAKEVFVQSNSQITAAAEAGGLAVTNLLVNKNVLAMVGVDHTIVFHTLDNFDCTKLLVGYCDEILDVSFMGQSDTHLAVASNSPDIKLYRLKDMHCVLLKGHSDLVLSVATCHSQRNLLASSAKDNTVKIWLLDEETGVISCIASGERHTASVGAVVFGQTSGQWLYSGSQDNCIKAWEITGSLENAVLNAKYSAIAHEKEINNLCVSPNDKIVASASQDKTVKLWNTDGLTLIGALRGHKRGVWCARFSPSDQILATGSADCTIKLWNLSDLTCIKTFEGHDASVLKLEFLSSGTQLFSCGGDGLLKLWTMKNSECTLTLDGHEGRVWALAVKGDETTLVTGGGDSKFVFWCDTTVEKQEKARIDAENRLLEDQNLSNLMHQKLYDRALELALRLERPNTALKIVQILSKEEKTQLRIAVKTLAPELQSSLLQMALKWNANTRNCACGQLILELMLTEGSVQLSPEDLAQALAYTTKHFQRLSQLRAEMHFLTYTAAQMALLPNEI